MHPLRGTIGDVALAAAIASLAAAASANTTFLLASPATFSLGRASAALFGHYSPLIPFSVAGVVAATAPAMLVGLRGVRRYIPIIAAALTPSLCLAWVSTVTPAASLVLNTIPPIAALVALASFDIWAHITQIRSLRPSIPPPAGSRAALAIVIALAGLALGYAAFGKAQALDSNGLGGVVDAIRRLYPSAPLCHAALFTPMDFDPSQSGVPYLGRYEVLPVPGYSISSREPKVGAILLLPAPMERPDGLLLQIQASSGSTMVQGARLPMSNGRDAVLRVVGTPGESSRLTDAMIERAVHELEQFCGSAAWNPNAPQPLPTFLQRSVNDLASDG